MDRRARIVRTRTGARLVQADATLSRVVDRPGPTHGLFDVLAAAVTAAAAGDRFLMLGFAAGGVVAPLRALGWAERIDAVDRSPVGTGLFRRLCGRWAGEVEIHRADAAAFLRRTRQRWDVILDDLSVLGPEGVQKPDVCYDELPELMRARLTARGVIVINALPAANGGWRLEELLRGNAGRSVGTAAYENRVLVTGPNPPAARALSLQLRGRLRSLDSRLAGQTTVRSLAR